MDPIVTCPYDEVHRIRKSVIPYHIIRCGKHYSSAGKIRCPFDAFHIIDEAYFQHHVENCASSGNVRRHIYDLEPPLQLGTIPLEAVKYLSVPIMKDWNKEPVETYDPWKHTETRSIIRSMPGGSKSKKKEFKVAERKRLQALETVNTFKPTLTTQFKHKEVRKSTNILELIKKMRRLSLDEFDILLQSIDISKLLISDIEDSKERCMSEVVEKMLVQKLKELMLHCLKKESF